MAPASSSTRRRNAERQLRPPTVNGKPVSAFLRFRSRHCTEDQKLGRRSYEEARVLFKDGTVAWVTDTPSLQWWRERAEKAKTTLQEAKENGRSACERPDLNGTRQTIFEEEEERCSKALAMLAFSSGLPFPFDAIRTNVLGPCSCPNLRSRLEILLRILLLPREVWCPDNANGWVDILPKLHPDKWLSCSGKELSKRAFLIAMREREKERANNNDKKESSQGENHEDEVLHSGGSRTAIRRAIEDEYMEAACRDECRVM